MQLIEINQESRKKTLLLRPVIDLRACWAMQIVPCTVLVTPFI